MRRKIAGLLILALVVSSACACGSKKEETKSETDTEISASVAAEVSASEEDNRETLFADAFARFETFVQAGKYEEAYLAAEEAAQYGDFAKKVGESGNNADDLTVIESAYAYLVANEPLKAAESVAERDSEMCQKFFSFVKENAYLIEEKTKSGENYESVDIYEYDDRGRQIRVISGDYEYTYEYGKNELIKRNNGEIVLYQKYNDDGKLVYEYNYGTEHRYDYDKSGKEQKRRLIAEDGTEFEFDESGNCIAEMHVDGSKILTKYDDEGRITKVIRKDYFSEWIDEYKYNNDGNLTEEKHTNAVGGVDYTKYEYDEHDNNISRHGVAGGNNFDSYAEYDEADRLMREYGSYYGRNERYTEYEHTYKYDRYGNKIEEIEINTDGTYDKHWWKYDVFGNMVNLKWDCAYDCEPDLNILTGETTKEYRYTFFVKSKEEDEDKNLWQLVEGLVKKKADAKSKEEPEDTIVSNEEAIKYAERCRLLIDNLPFGNAAVETDGCYLYYYSFEKPFNSDTARALFKKDSKDLNSISVYIVSEDFERQVGTLAITRSEDDEKYYYSSFSAIDSIGVPDGGFLKDIGATCYPGEIRNYDAQAGTIEVDLGTDTHMSFSGGISIKGLDDIYETYKVSDDAVLIAYSDGWHIETIVAKEYFNAVLDKRRGIQYSIGIKDGVIVWLCPIFSA